MLPLVYILSASSGEYLLPKPHTYPSPSRQTPSSILGSSPASSSFWIDYSGEPLLLLGSVEYPPLCYTDINSSRPAANTLLLPEQWEVGQGSVGKDPCQTSIDVIGLRV